MTYNSLLHQYIHFCKEQNDKTCITQKVYYLFLMTLIKMVPKTFLVWVDFVTFWANDSL